MRAGFLGWFKKKMHQAASGENDADAKKSGENHINEFMIELKS